MKLEEKLNELKKKGLEVFSYPDNVQQRTIVEISTKGIPDLDHGFDINAFFKEIMTQPFSDYTVFGFSRVVIYLTVMKDTQGGQ